MLDKFALFLIKFYYKHPKLCDRIAKIGNIYFASIIVLSIVSSTYNCQNILSVIGASIRETGVSVGRFIQPVTTKALQVLTLQFDESQLKSTDPYFQEDYE